MTLDAIGVAAFDTNLGRLDNSRALYSCIVEVGDCVEAQFSNPLKVLFCKLFPMSAAGQEYRGCWTDSMQSGTN